MIGAGTYPTWPAPVSRTSGAGAAQQGGGSACNTESHMHLLYNTLLCMTSHHSSPAAG